MARSTALAPRPSLTLRPYQQNAVDAVARAYLDLKGTEQVWKQLLVMGTGCGKTICFASLPQHPAIARWMRTFPERQRKMLIIAHREELLDQAADKMVWANPELHVDIEQADRHASPMADVVIGSVQTLSARNGRRLRKFDLEDFRIVVIDECHHSTAPTYRTILENFNFIPPKSFMPPEKRFGDYKEALAFQRTRLQSWDGIAPRDRLLIGVTATAKRGDNIGLEAIFQRVVFERNIRDLIGDGFLCRLRGIRVVSATCLDRVRTVAGDFNQGDLERTVDVFSRNQLAVKAYLDHANGRRAVVFCVSVAHAKAVADAFREANIRAEAIDGSMGSEERHAILSRYRTGKTSVLCNCQIVSEGVDIPEIDCIIHARPTKSSLFYIQTSGRGMRLAPGKTDCLIIDIVDSTRRHSLVTAPSLFGLPVDFDLEGNDILGTLEEVERARAVNEYLDLGGVRNLKDVQLRIEEVDLFAITDAQIEQYATMTWIKRGDAYLLGYPGEFGQESLEILQNALGQWEVMRVQVSRTPIVGPQAEIAQAFGEAERWLRGKFPDLAVMKDRKARWQYDQPTEAQLSYLRTLGGHAKPDMKRGQVSALIDIYLRRQWERRKARWRQSQCSPQATAVNG